MDSQNCAKAHRVEFMSLVDGKLLNAYICDKKFEPILHLINQMNSSYAPLANQPHPNQTQTYPGYPSQQNVTLGNSNPQNSQQTLNSAINSPPFNPSFQQQIPSGPTGANYFAPPFPGQTGSTGENASYFNST